MLTRELLKKVRKIEIRSRRIVDELTGGAYLSVFKGAGIEFDEVREYLPGDDVRNLDWNVTARMNSPYVKKYVEERELRVFLLVDVSASGDFGSINQSKNELAAELAALLAFSAIRNHDLVGLMLFSTQEELHLPARKGRRHGLRLIRELLACERRAPQTSIRNALEIYMRANKRRSVVFLISDFLDSGYERILRTANRKHDIIAMRLLDPRELELPAAGFINFEDAESNELRLFPAWLGGRRQAFAKRSAALYGESLEAIRRAGVDLIDLRTDADYVTPLMQFFRRRRHRLRTA